MDSSGAFIISADEVSTSQMLLSTESAASLLMTSSYDQENIDFTPKRSRNPQIFFKIPLEVYL